MELYGCKWSLVVQKFQALADIVCISGAYFQVSKLPEVSEGESWMLTLTPKKYLVLHPKYQHTWSLVKLVSLQRVSREMVKKDHWQYCDFWVKNAADAALAEKILGPLSLPKVASFQLYGFYTHTFFTAYFASLLRTEWVYSSTWPGDFICQNLLNLFKLQKFSL